MSIKILILAFEKAAQEIGSTTKTHLSKHLSEVLQEDYKYPISERTLRDYYTNYKNNIGQQEDLKPKLIACLCQYLEYKDYADFIRKNPEIISPKALENDSVPDNTTLDKKANGKRKRIILIFTGMGLIALIWASLFFKDRISFNDNLQTCMTWADSTYIKISCNIAPYSDYGTQIEPMDEVRFKNLKKVKVTQAYRFFSEDGKPLVWYAKNKDGAIEYFTAPGLHPVTGETLRKITPHIIQKYVPIHRYQKDSFLQ